MSDFSNSTYPRLPPPGGGSMVAGPGPGTLDDPRGAVFQDVGDDEEGLDLKRYLAILLYRKWLLIIAVLLALIAGLFYTVREPPVYRATATVQATPPSGSTFGFTDLSAVASARNFTGDQLQLLRSTVLAERAAQTLSLDLVPDAEGDDAAPTFFEELQQALTQWWHARQGRAEPIAPDEQRDRLLDDPLASNQAAVAARIRSTLVATPVRDTNLIELTMEGSDPRAITAMLNAVAKTFVNFQTDRRSDEATSTLTFYDQQIQRTRIQLEDAERQLTDYARSKDLVHVDNLLEHSQAEYGALREKLGEAERNLFQAEAKMRAMNEIDAQGSADFLGSTVIQSLKTRRGELQDEYQRKLEVFLPDYPAMVQLRSQIEAIDGQIAAEVDSISRSLRIEYETILKERQLLVDRAEEARLDLLKLRDETVDYNALARSRDTLQAMYNGLLSRVTEAELVSGIVQDNIRIVDLATVPVKPLKPDLNKNLLVSASLGLVLGVLLILLLEHLDDSYKSNDEVEKETGRPVLGSLPFIDQSAGVQSSANLALSVASDPKGPLAEATRSLRTSLMFSTAEGAPRVLHFTSASPGEGKSFCCVSVASSFTQSGSTVLCIDCDLRNPSLHGIFDAPNDMGLTNYLTAEISPAEIAQATSVEGLFLISSGPTPPNPVELLSSGKMMHLLKLAAERFDYVLLDGPPVIGLADALVLSRMAGSSLLVIDTAKSTRTTVKESLKRLRGSQARIIGVVLQKVGQPGQRGYGYGYGYGYRYQYQYLYGYGQEHDERSPV